MHIVMIQEYKVGTHCYTGCRKPKSAIIWTTGCWLPWIPWV